MNTIAPSQEAPPANPLELAEYLIRHCERCPLNLTRTNAVPGEGPINAEVMLIAEGPGKNEDREGRPFVGAAGRLLDQLLPEADLERSQVYITNMVKCRTPENRDPLPEELAACSSHLDRQLAIINPKLVIALGKHSLTRFLPEEPSIGQAQGKLRRRRGRFIFPIMHPAAGLRKTAYRDAITGHFREIPEVLRRIEHDPPEEEPEPTQTPQYAKQRNREKTRNQQASLL